MTSDIKPIRTALVSVFHKDGLDHIINALAASGVKFLSTGGTRQFIESLGCNVTLSKILPVIRQSLEEGSDLASKSVRWYFIPRDNETDREQVSKYEIPDIDLVIVDLYPFEATVASGAPRLTLLKKR